MITTFLETLSSFLFPTCCYICKKGEEPLCEKCLKSFQSPLDSPNHWTTSLYSFRDERVKKVVHAIKFFHRKDLVTPIAKKLISQLPTSSFNWVLVPVPVHFFRKVSRGYNQAEVIARALSKESGLLVTTTVLKKTHQTKRQAISLSRKERLRNQKGTFKVVKNITGKNIILIDDVTTTGATLEEARRALVSSGASHVIAITIAH